MLAAFQSASEEPPEAGVSKDRCVYVASWFETRAKERAPHHEGLSRINPKR